MAIVSLEIFEAAVTGNDAKASKLLVADKSLANAVSPDGWSVLALAARFGQETIVEVLLRHGAQPNTPAKLDPQPFPLHTAAGGKHTGCAQLLLDAGAEANCVDANGWTPLHFAAKTGNLDLVHILVNVFGAELNPRTKDGKTPLAVAKAHGGKDVIDLITHFGGEE